MRNVVVIKECHIILCHRHRLQTLTAVTWLVVSALPFSSRPGNTHHKSSQAPPPSTSHPHRDINRLAADHQLQKVCNFPAGLVNILLVTMTNLEFCLRSRAWSIVWWLVRSYENIKISDTDWPLLSPGGLQPDSTDCQTSRSQLTSFISVKISTSLLRVAFVLISNIKLYGFLLANCFNLNLKMI